MPTITNLEDLLVHQLRDLYSAEQQLVKALPVVARHSSADALQEALTAHVDETVEHLQRLEHVFERLGVSARGPKCRAMEGLIEEATSLFDHDIELNTLDAGIVASVQRVEHYELAAYGTAVAFARQLGNNEVMDLLQRTLAEEHRANETLTALAESGINALAQQGGEADAQSAQADGNGLADHEVDDDDSDDEPTARVERMRSPRPKAKTDGGRRVSQPPLRVIRPH